MVRPSEVLSIGLTPLPLTPYLSTEIDSPLYTRLGQKRHMSGQNRARRNPGDFVGDHGVLRCQHIANPRANTTVDAGRPFTPKTQISEGQSYAHGKDVHR